MEQDPGARGLGWGWGGLPGGRGSPRRPRAAAGHRARAGAAAATGGAARRGLRLPGARKREAEPGRPPCRRGPGAPAAPPWRAAKRCRGRSEPEGKRAPVGGARRSRSPERRGRGRSRAIPLWPCPPAPPLRNGTRGGRGRNGASPPDPAPPGPQAHAGWAGPSPEIPPRPLPAPPHRSSSLEQSGRDRTPSARQSSPGGRFVPFPYPWSFGGVDSASFFWLQESQRTAEIQERGVRFLRRDGKWRGHLRKASGMGNTAVTIFERCNGPQYSITIN